MTLQKDFPDLVNKSGIFDYLANYIHQKSQVVNITAIKDYDMIWLKHIIDSLMFFKTDFYLDLVKADSNAPLNQKRKLRCIDIGTGGGFPGLPLAIAFDGVLNYQFDLLDGTQKKLKVIDEFVSTAKETGLCDLSKDVLTVWGRAEELNRKPQYKGIYDIVTVRSLAYIDKLIEYTLSFVSSSGVLVIYKEYSDAEDSELRAVLAKNRLVLITQYKYDILQSNRVIYIVGKSK